MHDIVPEGGRGGGETIFLSHAVYNNRVSRYRGSNVFQSAEYLSRAMGALSLEILLTEAYVAIHHSIGLALSTVR